ncbi:hypothetical protein FJV80_04295 [Mesorhizobium sp. WSM4310]|uniref:hypothetical protein n=1 Tax=Mesorhizobium sp. WSM4310 TaxID=2589883 RepID=UPI00115CFE24|nr:hypothetical protein [Mesorhizobium sp. WSM4310]TRC91148.1 hypothetical protein FJV80_04295 [Mesorhizobium sp. WSM4310]
MQVTRTFSHREFGNLGEATLAVEKGKWMLDGQALPDTSVEYLMGFALQSLQDAYAGAKNQEAAGAAFDAKRKRLIEGVIGRQSGQAEEPHVRFIRQMVRNALSPDNKARYETTDAKERNKFLMGLFGGLAPAKRDRLDAQARTAYEASLAAKAATEFELTI